jgi:hypothetical protein
MSITLFLKVFLKFWAFRFNEVPQYCNRRPRVLLPHFTHIPAPADDDVMLFTMTKLSGHDSSRLR